MPSNQQAWPKTPPAHQPKQKGLSNVLQHAPHPRQNPLTQQPTKAAQLTEAEGLGIQRQHGLPDVLQRGVDAAQEDGQAGVDRLVEVGEALA